VGSGYIDVCLLDSDREAPRLAYYRVQETGFDWGIIENLRLRKGDVDKEAIRERRERLSGLEWLEGIRW